MDEKIIKILSEKLDDSLNQNSNDIEKIMLCFEQADVNSLHTGILVGRLYNSFYYQHRRILKRTPSEDEFNEFVDFIKKRLKLFSK
jgi:hypothetical protein|tara:strand:- start:1470 stop:1727 length:258 start_codon:yes stop_codon:yes gene_type:complete